MPIVQIEVKNGSKMCVVNSLKRELKEKMHINLPMIKHFKASGEIRMLNKKLRRDYLHISLWSHRLPIDPDETSRLGLSRIYLSLSSPIKRINNLKEPRPIFTKNKEAFSEQKHFIDAFIEVCIELCKGEDIHWLTGNAGPYWVWYGANLLINKDKLDYVCLRNRIMLDKLKTERKIIIRGQPFVVIDQLGEQPTFDCSSIVYLDETGHLKFPITLEWLGKKEILKTYSFRYVENEKRDKLFIIYPDSPYRSYTSDPIIFPFEFRYGLWDIGVCTTDSIQSALELLDKRLGERGAHLNLVFKEPLYKANFRSALKQFQKYELNPRNVWWRPHLNRRFPCKTLQ